ncbi:MAG TPA: hypothetical protein VLL54_02365 [Pyrinomonadaceae bacterium]|nr:hypothetical protein [Pyrinomonadaceae bacterium]
MIRIILRVLAVLFLLGGLLGSAVAAYLLLSPSEEETLYEQKQKESVAKYEQAQAATNPIEKAQLLKESEEAGDSARVWEEGARARRIWPQLGIGVGVVVCFFSIVIFGLTFIGRKRTSTA